MDKNIYFILEYMEETFSEWSNAEILQMIKYLSRTPRNILVITNIDKINNNQPEEFQTLFDDFMIKLNQDQPKNVYIIGKKLEYIYNNTENFVFDDFLYPKNSQKFQINIKKVCLLDMRGKETLQTSDANNIEAFVFGGILGDHPPRDRTKELRDTVGIQRNLHQMQMSTDTALLVTDIILNENRKFEDIPFIDAPEIQNPNDEMNTVQMEGFRYVTTDYDIEKRQINKTGTKDALICPKIKNELLFQEFDLDFMQQIIQS